MSDYFVVLVFTVGLCCLWVVFVGLLCGVVVNCLDRLPCVNVVGCKVVLDYGDLLWLLLFYCVFF